MKEKYDAGDQPPRSPHRGFRETHGTPGLGDCGPALRPDTGAMWEERAERARREIAALAAGGLDLADLYASALAVVRQAVPFEQGCWAGVDPDIAGDDVRDQLAAVAGDGRGYSARFAESEYTGHRTQHVRRAAAPAAARRQDFRCPAPGGGPQRPDQRPAGAAGPGP